MKTNIKGTQKKEIDKFSTGSVRDYSGCKPRLNLISPYAELVLARALGYGAKKYGDRNWEKGQPIMRIVDSAKRHLNAFIRREPGDDHYSKFLCNAHFIAHTMEMIRRGWLPKELDDRPNWRGQCKSRRK